MTNEFIAYPPELTVRDAFEKFKMDAHDVETVYYIYIVENERLIGVTTLKDMILTSPQVPLSEIMVTKLKTVSADTNQQVVAETVSKYNLVAIPVVDDEGELLGIVTIDDIIDILLPPAARKKRRSV
jgi:Mg/Co/Ni transporter MgtE